MDLLRTATKFIAIPFLLFSLASPVLAQEVRLVSSSEGMITDIVLSGVPPSRCLMLDLIYKMIAIAPERELHVYYETKELFQENTDKQACDIALLEMFEPVSKYSANSDLVLDESQDSYSGNVTKGFAHRISTSGISYNSKWPQDAFNLIEVNEQSKMNVTENRDESDRAFYEAFYSETLNLIKTKHSFSEKDGNIQFLDNNVFMGIDALQANEWKSIEDFYSGNNILTLGSNTPRIHENGVSYQPAFHIDLFFNAIKLKTNHYLFVYSKYDNPKNHSKQILWNTQVEEIHEHLLSQLPEDILVDRLDIPLVMVNNKAYSFSNAIFETVDNKIYAYLPFYLHVPYHIHVEVKKRFAHLGIKVFFIRNVRQGFDEYIQQQGALHCMTKVLHRN